MLRMVDLPQPEWPMTQANSPSATLNHRSSKTVSSPLPDVSANRRVRPCALMKAALIGALQDEVIAIRNATRQTVFMITHDVDEALLLADKILLMTNGPKAWIAEIVDNTLPKARTRAELHKLADYYPLRNHLIEFLVTRSRELAGAPEPGVEARRNPPVVRPTASFNPHASTPALSQSPAQAAPILAASARVSAA